ncbi:MAG: TIGR02466 family protein [Pseudomonadota bacterium]
MTERPTEILKGRVGKAFATPIAAYVWPDSAALNAALRAQILEREGKGAGLAKSNLGGWHSEADLLLWGGQAVAVLQQRMLRMAAEATGQSLRGTSAQRFHFAVEAWANVSRDGNYNSVHAHPGAHWSGVTYVSIGEPDAEVPMNGHIEFIDPRTGPGILPLPAGTFEERNIIAPVEGMMLLFPSWLKHQVHPFRGRGERISIAFNVRISKPTEEAD